MKIISESDQFQERSLLSNQIFTCHSSIKITIFIIRIGWFYDTWGVLNNCIQYVLCLDVTMFYVPLLLVLHQAKMLYLSMCSEKPDLIFGFCWCIVFGFIFRYQVTCWESPNNFKVCGCTLALILNG